MADPNLELYDTNEVLISSGNKIAFGQVEKGTKSTTFKTRLYNDKGKALGSDIAVSPLIAAISSPDDISVILNGTPFNGSKSMLEARSCGASGVAADQDADWTPISQTDYLQVGDIPAGAYREIWFRLNVPLDAGDLAASDFTVRINV